MELISKLKQKAKELKAQVVPMYYALFDKRTPLFAKIMAAITVMYLLSPIDLIPDFIPILGLLDDIILVPLMVTLTLKFIPKEIIEEYQIKSRNAQPLKAKWYYAVPVIVVYLLLLLWFLKIAIRYFKTKPL